MEAIVYYKTMHIQSKKDLTVTINLPEEFLEKDIKISAVPISGETPDSEDKFFTWLRRRGLKTKGWKFNRDEANER